MSTNKHIDQICIAGLVVSIVLTLLVMNLPNLGIQVGKSSIGYENRIFDNSIVHTIDIVIDDWDSFIPYSVYLH